jgi:thiol-disulfide isomerase/thioredoxin
MHHQARTEIVKLPVLLLAAQLLSAQTAPRPLDTDTYLNVVSSHRDRVLLVNFWATWCGPCVTEIPALLQLARKYKPEGFALMFVSADEPEDEEKAVSFLVKHRVPWPHYVKRAKDDDAFIRTIDRDWSGELPALILYDRKGKKVRFFSGETPVKEVETAIKEALGVTDGPVRLR